MNRRWVPLQHKITAFNYKITDVNEYEDKSIVSRHGIECFRRRRALRNSVITIASAEQPAHQFITPKLQKRLKSRLIRESYGIWPSGRWWVSMIMSWALNPEIVRRTEETQWGKAKSSTFWSRESIRNFLFAFVSQAAEKGQTNALCVKAGRICVVWNWRLADIINACIYNRLCKKEEKRKNSMNERKKIAPNLCKSTKLVHQISKCLCYSVYVSCRVEKKDAFG